MANYADCQKETKLICAVSAIRSEDSFLRRWNVDTASLYAYDLGIVADFRWSGDYWHEVNRREIR